MRSANKVRLFGLAAGIALIIAIPVIGQEKPESILPPGFGDPVEAPEQPNEGPKPADLLPDVAIQDPSRDNATRSPSSQASIAPEPGFDGLLPLPEGETGVAPVEAAVLRDLPDSVRRSTAQVGILGPTDGDMGPGAFGSADGKYLEHLMRSTRAPLPSRWASIVLRRALLSRSITPGNLNGADWVAERAWLLLRMGEADAARTLVQSVDIDQYTPKMYQVALQAALASGDPAGACPFADQGAKAAKDPAWPMVRAMCAALSGESAQASALMDIARSKRSGRGIDGTLAEKVVGAGNNTRRAVVVQWDGVRDLTAWRFGLAGATAVEIPAALFNTVGPHVRAWQARSPLLPAAKREQDAEIAAALGVFSADALVDVYGQIADETDASDASGKTATLLQAAYAGSTPEAKLTAMRNLWAGASKDIYGPYARMVVTSRAAAMLPADGAYANDSDALVASMMSAGLDIQAAKWASVIKSGSPAWASLAVGALGKTVDWSRGNIESFQSNSGGEDGLRGRFLFAGMAGLDRMDQSAASDMASDLSLPIGRTTRWTIALERAVVRQEPATVALLCALGLQGRSWKSVSPAMLYHAISALRRVGLTGEARMIAAEAVARG
jgi:hypothetical protein